jgi:hypothetical protein
LLVILAQPESPYPLDAQIPQNQPVRACNPSIDSFSLTYELLIVNLYDAFHIAHDAALPEVVAPPPRIVILAQPPASSFWRSQPATQPTASTTRRSRNKSP